MVSFSWQYDFTGAARTWVVSVMFCLTGLICGVILPLVIGSQEGPGSLRSEGAVLRVEAEDGMERPVFGFVDRQGVEHEFSSDIASNRSAYRAGDRVTVSFEPARPAAAFVIDDKDMAVMFWILRVLGMVFGGLGLAILGMKLKGVDDEVISRVGGLLGALTYAIPASLVLPGLWQAHQGRPNWLFAADDSFGFEQWLIGSIFSATGLLVLVVTVVLYRYQARTGESGWYWHWDNSGSGRKGRR